MKKEPSIGKKAIFFTVTAVLVFLTVLNKTSLKEVFYFGDNAESYYPQEFLTGSELLFVENSRNFISEDVAISFIEESSIFAVSSPLIYTENLLLGTGNFLEEREEVFEYLVEEGETVSSIAKKFNISTNTIIWANKLSNSSANVVGKKLVILPVSGVIHEVKKGDTISSIAESYKAKRDEIISFNKIEDESGIYIGDILIVPNGVIPVVRPPAPVQPSFSGFILPVQRSGSYISQGLHFYNAIDIANRCGVPVYASAAGTVQVIGYHNIGGNYVRILHSNGMVTYYGHLSRISVSRGQRVSQGQIIGYVGNTGYTIGRTGCHLHFEVRGGTNPFARYRVGHRF